MFGGTVVVEVACVDGNQGNRPNEAAFATWHGSGCGHGNIPNEADFAEEVDVADVAVARDDVLQLERVAAHHAAHT